MQRPRKIARVAEPASPLQVTPDLRRRVRDSIVRTMQQRVPAWEALMLRRVKSSGPEQP